MWFPFCKSLVSLRHSCGRFSNSRGGVRRAVPKGFPYFHVEWDDGGYAHVIEGEVNALSCR